MAITEEKSYLLICTLRVNDYIIYEVSKSNPLKNVRKLYLEDFVIHGIQLQVRNENSKKIVGQTVPLFNFKTVTK
jgi:hypothetical protein